MSLPNKRNHPIKFSQISEQTIDDQADGLSRLHERIHGQWRQPEYWRWCYLETPIGSGTIVATKDESVIGKLGSVYSTLSLNGRSVKASLLEGLEVLPEERSWQCFRGILASSLEAGETDRVELGFAFSNRTSAKMNQQIGWASLGRVPVLAAFIDVRQALSDRSLPAPIPWLSCLAAPFLEIRFKKQGDHFDGYEFRSILEFTADFDDLWASVESARTVSIVKNASYLNWRYLRCPGRDHQCWAVYRENLLQGWVVFRARQTHREGCLLDLVARDNAPHIIEKLVQWTLQNFASNRVGLVRASFPKASPEGRVLRKQGFHAWTTAIAGIELVTTGPRDSDQNELAELEMADWHISLGDWLYY